MCVQLLSGRCLEFSAFDHKKQILTGCYTGTAALWQKKDGQYT